jgi:hypothetical protein
MTNTPTTLERAFALARSGEHATVSEIRLALKRERYDQVEAHLQGGAITRQLRQLCAEARREGAAAAPAAPASDAVSESA